MFDTKRAVKSIVFQTNKIETTQEHLLVAGCKLRRQNLATP